MAYFFNCGLRSGLRSHFAQLQLPLTVRMEITVLIAGVAALVWTAALLRYGGLLAGCLLVILTGACLGHPFFHVSVITLDRVLVAALVGYYLIDRRLNPRPVIQIAVPDVLLALVLVILFVSTFANDWRIDGAQPASRFLFLYLMPATMYWLGRETKVGTDQARWLILCFALFGIYLALTAVAEMRGWSAFIFPRYIISSEFEEFLGRGRGPFLNPSANGIHMTTALACLLMLWPRCNMQVRVAIVLGAIILAAGCFATLTRCVWLGMVLGSMTLVWLCFPRRIRLGLLTLVFCAMALGVSVGWNHLVAFKRDKDVPASQMAESAKLRPMLAAVAWQMFQEKPLTGYGLGQYSHHDDVFIAARRVDMPLDRVRPYHQHNFILSLLTETGVAGTLPFIGLICCWATAALQLWKNHAVPLEIRQLGLVFLVCLVNYVTNGTFQDVTLIPTVNLLLFYLGGITVSAVMATEGSQRWQWRRLLAGVQKHHGPVLSPNGR